ncbi:MAG: Mu-like prophage FluMu protein [Myxococcaceae bacterium]|nr:Mu-like prophage FluMu protein [Myxococcaceae bacterium]
MATWKDMVGALLGVSTYAAAPANQPSLDDGSIERLRAVLGGQLSPLPTTRTRWYLADLETAQHAADAGDISIAAQLWRSMRRDAVLAGVLSTRSGGLVHLPKRFSGRADIVKALQGRDGVRSVFDAMFPPAELELLGSDGIGLGIAVGEMQPVKGRDYPVLVRLDPEFLRFRWNESRWYYQSVAGSLPITPGDGRWVLHVPGGRVAPWNNGLWQALGRSWINKEHAQLHKANWEAKLANPARAATAPIGASEAQRVGFLQRLISWGVNTVFELPPGWDVKIIESNGRGHESFETTIDRSDREYMIGIAGQVVTVTGGTGFANADIHKSIRADLITSTGVGLANTVSTQGIPPYVVRGWGVEALDETAVVEWDTRPPQDQKADADAIGALGEGIEKANAALAPYGVRVDAPELARGFGLPLVAIEVEAPKSSGALENVTDDNDEPEVDAEAA